jgi:phosphoglucosamine mutase
MQKMSKNQVDTMTQSEQTLFGSSGIRGKVNEFVSGSLAIRVGLATAELLLKQQSLPRVIVGHDHRLTGPMLTSALISGLLSGGCNVNSAGMAPTPTVAYAAGRKLMSAAIIVTASHNPPEYNGFKFHNPDGAGFSTTQQKQIETLLKSSKAVSWESFGTLSDTNPIPLHHNAIIDATEVRNQHRVVLDGALGVGGLVTPLALRTLKIKTTTLNIQPNGKDYAQNIGSTKLKSAAAAEWQHFVNLDILSDMVRSTKAEVGFAHDGDADRLLVVDNKGRVLAGDTLLALLADYYLSTRSGKIIATTVSCSNVVDHIAKKHDARVIRSRVGDVFVSNLIKKHNAVLGGEPSGPFIFPEVHYCPDGPLAACKVLEMLGWAQKPLNTLVDDLPQTHLLRASVACPNDKKQKAMNRVERMVSKLKQIEDLSQVDGIRASFTDSSWVLIRPSGTEPVIRITVEALTQARAKTLLSESRQRLRKSIT